MTLWYVFYDKQTDFQLVEEQNPGVCLIDFNQEGSVIKGRVQGNKARFVNADQIVIPDKDGAFVLSLKPT